MASDRPFLTAHWRELLLLNFEVPAAVVAPYAPPGTDIDFHDGRTYLSIVGFRFLKARLWGMAIPGHRAFDEVNLRLYVRRVVGDEVRRGVVFVREIVPRWAVTAVARWLYGESFVTLPVWSDHRLAGAVPSPGDSVDYCWQTRRDGQRSWNRAGGRVAESFGRPAPDSLSEFIIEHYWAYVGRRRRPTTEFRVEHPPWNVAAVDNVVWDCDLSATFPTPLARCLDRPPVSAFVANGSAVSVARGAEITNETGPGFAATRRRVRQAVVEREERHKVRAPLGSRDAPARRG